MNSLTDLQVAPALLDAKRRAAPQTRDVEEDPKPAEPVQDQTMSTDMTGTTAVVKEEQPGSPAEGSSSSNQREDDGDDDDDDDDFATPVESPPAASDAPRQRPGIHPRAASLAHVATREDYPTPRSRITFDPSADMRPNSDGALRIPGPRERDRGAPLLELTETRSVKAEGRRTGKTSGRMMADDGQMLMNRALSVVAALTDPDSPRHALSTVSPLSQRLCLLSAEGTRRGGRRCRRRLRHLH